MAEKVETSGYKSENLLLPEDKTNIFLRNTGKYLPN